MFLDWISQLGLLQHDPQTNILGPLPLSIRRALISEITAYLHPAPGKPAPDPAIFASPAHVKWFMEVLGQGFSLPLEDVDITSNDVSIYAQWLFEPHMRPAAVVQDGLEQEFYQIIFHQLSLIFHPRLGHLPSSLPKQSSSHSSSTATASTSASAGGGGGGGSGGGGRPNSLHLGMMPVNAHANLVPVSLPSPTAPHHTPSTPTSAPPHQLSQLVHRHIELCKKTLTVLAMAGRTLDLSPETWSILLKVVLGVSDSLLKEPIREPSTLPNMADELCEHLLRVLFELWLRSGIQQVEMWDILKSCFTRWVHRSKAIQQWSSTSLSLCNRILNLTYGREVGTDMVILSANGINVRLDLPPEFVYYAWHRILYLAPHPLQLPPLNFTLAMLGIGQLVDTFNTVGDTASAIIEPPAGNTILHMFATYLFDACATAPQADIDSQRGCAEAFGTVCKIFSRPQRLQPFLRTYVERFYAALTVGLKSDACLPTILINSTELFAADLEGVRMLVPDFISAIKMVLPKLQIVCKDFVAVDDLRLAAIKVVSTIMCLPNHFDKVELKPGWDWDMQCASDNASVLGEQEQIVTQLIRVLYADQARENMERPYTCLKFYILELLLMSLRTETSSYNMRYLLHLINVYVIEDVPFCPGLVGTVVKLIQEKILTMQMPSDVTLVAFDVLMDFVDLYDYVKRDSKNVARELVLALSRYVDILINAGKLIHSYPLIVQAYDCMTKWILVSQWIVDDRDCYKAVIATLSKGITIFDRETEAGHHAAESHPPKKRRDTTFPPTKQLFQLPPRANKSAAPPAPAAATASEHHPGHRNNSTVHKKEEVAVRMAAEYCMSQFVNHLGRFSSWNTRNMPDSHKDDAGVRYFLVDKRMILAIVDSPHDQPVPAVEAVIRDTTGRYTWSIEMRYRDPHQSAVPSITTTPCGTPSRMDSDISWNSTSIKNEPFSDASTEVPTATAVNEDALPKIDMLFEKNSDDWRQWEFIRSLADQEEKAEMAALKGKRDAVEPLVPTQGILDTENPRGFRLLLSELGVLLPEKRARITPLRVTGGVANEIETLDLLNERDCISITAYYATSGNISWPDLVETPDGVSEPFMQFLSCLGWPISIEQHSGFKGKLNSSFCKTTSYYTDRTIEFVVNSPCLLQKTTEEEGELLQIHQQVSMDDHVCVIWIEDLANYKQLAKRIKTEGSGKAMVYIFINPLKDSADSLYWIRILIPPFGNGATSIVASQRLSENALIFGPLVDGIVVSRHALGSMVRNTTISAHQACRVVTDTYTRPYVMRKQFIEEMAHRHRTKLPLSEFYSEVFVGKDA